MALRVLRRENPLPADASAWLQLLSEAAEDLAPETLGCSVAGVTSYRGELEPAACAVLLPVAGDDELLQVGLCCAPAAARTLSAAFLGQADPEALGSGDIADALGELLNSWMSAVLMRLGAPARALRLGLPLLVSGPLQAGPAAERSGLSMTLGPTSVQLVVMRRAE